MSRRIVAVAIIAIIAISSLVAPGFAAAVVGEDGTGADADPVKGTIGVNVTEVTTGGGGRSSCTWSVFMEPIFNPEIGNTGPYVREGSNGPETLYAKRCPGKPLKLYWISNSTTDTDMINIAFAEARKTLPLPVMDMSPDPAIGGVVNLGMWLAINDPGEVPVTATAGAVSATVTAKLVSVQWSMGNGDVVDCAGIGTAISDSNLVEQGPCGYTYRWPSSRKYTGNDTLAYDVSVTGHWEVTFTTSTGRSGTLAPIDRTTSFAYQVREIQTVGVAD